MGIFRHPASSVRRDRFSVRRAAIALSNFFRPHGQFVADAPAQNIKLEFVTKKNKCKGKPGMYMGYGCRFF
jgi:hypothetical protein